MGNLYLEQARFLLKYEDFATAAYFLDKGREYIPDSRELHYLSNLLLLKTGEIQPLLASLGKAAPNREPHMGEDRLMLPLLGRTKRYDEVLQVFDRWKDQADWTHQEAAVAARALAAKNRSPEALRLLREALLLYPLDDGLTRLLLELSPESRQEYTERLWSKQFLSQERENRILLMLLPFWEGEEFLQGWDMYQQRQLFSLEAEIRRGELFGWPFSPPWWKRVFFKTVFSPPGSGTFFCLMKIRASFNPILPGSKAPWDSISTGTASSRLPRSTEREI